MKAISALNPPKSSGEMSKVRWKQTKCSKDFRFCKERTSRRMPLCLIALENNENLSDMAAREDGWEVESLILLCEVLLVWNHSTCSGSRLLRLLLVPKEELHFLIGLCGLWIQGRCMVAYGCHSKINNCLSIFIVYFSFLDIFFVLIDLICGFFLF